MTTDSLTLSKGDVAVAPSQVRPASGSFAQRLLQYAPLLAIIAQFGLIVMIVQDRQLESLSLARVMQLAFAGFIIHHLLPQRLRLPFFATLSLIGVVIVTGQMGPKTWLAALTGGMAMNNFLYRLLPGITLIGVGLGLIGLCHIPVRFWTRVALVAIAGAALTFLRANSQWFPDVADMWVILGSMFMFRLMIYLYDLKHHTVPFSASRAISYFFLLPNVCFPLFPVVDYKTLCTTYYNEESSRIYQSGVRWMMRGVVQLVLYRIVYQFAPLDVSKLSSFADVTGFMVAMYLVYLRVSGTFHLIVGLLHMFGFNLPETHHLYFLATSFTDLWRRINIYWKDFVMKLFFYPVHFKLRKLGTIQAMSLATLVTFVATWALHSWQWFWIRGNPLLSWKDFAFWMILGALVLINALRETTRGRTRSLTPSRTTMSQRWIRGLKAAGMFSVMCALWTFWTCQSWDELRTLVDAASRPHLRDIVIILAGLGVIVVSAMLWGRSTRETSEGRSTAEATPPFRFWSSATTVMASALCMLVLPSLSTRMTPPIQRFIARLDTDALNERDLKQQRRGYYEELDVRRVDNLRRWGKGDMAEGWTEGKKVFYRERPDFLLSEIVPSITTTLGGVRTTSNRWGMRDRDYEKAKPATTYRIVLLGASHDQGTGVKLDETYENLVEDRLNRDQPDPRHSRYEILNMSVGGYGVLQRELRLEEDGFQFQPDAVMFSVAAADRQFLVQHLRSVLTLGIEPPPAYREMFESVISRAHVHKGMPDVMIERRLQPYVDEIYEWTFRRFAQLCQQHGIRPLIIYRPAPLDLEGIEQNGRMEIKSLARGAGVEVIDLSSAFDSTTDRRSLVLAKWDDHTTTTGHRLLADKLYDGLIGTLFKSSEQSAMSQQVTTKP